MIFHPPTEQQPRRQVGGLVGLGCVLVISGFAHLLVSPPSDHEVVHSVLEVALLGGPGIGLLAIVHRVSEDSIDVDLYSTLTHWTLGTAVLLVVVGWLLLVYFEVPYWSHDTLFVYNFWLAVGAFGGALIGSHVARGITQARKAWKSQEERDRFKYLNHLLRHDLSNNLMVIQGNTELALEQADEEIADHLKTIQRQSEQATTLIRNVRILVQASQEDKSLEPTGLTATIEEEVSHLRDAYPEATIKTDVPESVLVRANALLGSVFENLLRNAIQHNDSENPQITISVETDTDTVTASVTDNGSGIPPEVRESLFEPSEDGAHGFGLYLVHTLVTRYDGQVTIKDTGPDGTTMQVELNCV